MNLGEILDGAFRSIRANPAVMFGLSTLVVVAASALALLIQLLLMPYFTTAIGAAVPTDLDPVGDATDAFGVATAQVVAILPAYFLATAVITGLLTASVSRSVIGEKIGVGEVWRRYWKRSLLIVVFSFLLQAALATVWVAASLGVVALVVADSIGLAVTVAVVGVIALVVGSIWVTVRLIFVPPVLVLEQTGLWTSVRRGWALSRGSFWRVFGIYLLTIIMLSVVAQVVVLPVGLVAALVFPDPTSLGSIFVTTLGNALAQLITSIFVAAVVALLYIDVRIRREGLDVSLARAAQESAAQGSTAR